MFSYNPADGSTFSVLVPFLQIPRLPFALLFSVTYFKLLYTIDFFQLC